MLKKYLFMFILTSSALIGADSDVARGEARGGHYDNHDRRDDYNRGRGYNRYENAHYFDNRGIQNQYDHRRYWNNGNNGGDVLIDDGVLLNNQPNPDVQYTQPGITDNFNAVYEQNNQ